MKVYNFRLKEGHTYFVRETSSQAESVWVHNLYEQFELNFDGPTDLQQQGALREFAKRVHGAALSEIALSESAVVVSEAGGSIYASASGGRLTPLQRQMLVEAGVPEGNIFWGARFTKGFSRLENHGERIILRNLPKDATPTRWGISWTWDQRPNPCSECAPYIKGTVEGM